MLADQQDDCSHRRPTRRSRKCEPGGDWVVRSRGEGPSSWLEAAIAQRRKAPSQSAVEQAIASAHWILELEDDWDGQGSSRYAPAVLERASKFLMESADWLMKTQGGLLQAPDIGAGPNGSIDLHWRLPHFELLVNVPSDPSTPVSFYGDEEPGLSIKGTATTEGGPLLLWLAAHLR